MFRIPSEQYLHHMPVTVACPRQNINASTSMLLQETGKRHKVLKLPPSTTGYQVLVNWSFAVPCVHICVAFLH